MGITSDSSQGLLLGTAVGDAIGLPREMLSPRRAAKLFGGSPLRHRLLPFGRGMMSDDTENTCMTMAALIASGGDVDRFRRSLAWRLRGWFVALPAGVGMATAKACLKLWIGFPPTRSGVRSAGNGPAMRAAAIGAFFARELDRLKAFSSASCRLTHTHPDAEAGALAVSLAAAFAVRRAGPSASIAVDAFVDFARPHLADTPMLVLIEEALTFARRGESLQEYVAAKRQPRGISGWINHTVPAALLCWARHGGDVRSAVEEIVTAGGDTDSTGAIVGALCGLTGGIDSVPSDWVDGLLEWPRSNAWMRRLADEFAAAGSGTYAHVPTLFWPAIPFRNGLFLAVVLLHGLRRLLPPY